jgi:putative NADPH-quinone reductase
MFAGRPPCGCILNDVNVLLVLCHPFERSFCRAVADRVEQAATDGGAAVTRHDLYSVGFDPVLSGAELARRASLEPTVQRFSSDVTSADRLVFVHPDWWSGPPALMKGWIERVFRPGVAYDWTGKEFSEKQHEPLLAGRSALVLIPTDREEEPQSLRLFWSEVCQFSGITLSAVRIFPDVRNSTFRARRAWLNEVETHVNRLVGTEVP